MDEDEQERNLSALITELAREDISTLSRFELEARIEALKAEISRAETAIEQRGDSRAAAEALFKT